MSELDDLCDFEKDVLRQMNGEHMGIGWGAAMGAALEHLKSIRLVYIDSNFGYRLTDTGSTAAVLFAGGS